MLIKIKNSIIDKIAKITVWHHNVYKLIKKRNAFHSWLKNTLPNNDYLTRFSENNRSVEIKDWEKDKEELILTCYFTQKKDPQLGIVRINPEIDYIRPWYLSIVKNKLHGIILHDGLNDDFIKAYENEFVQFRKVIYGNYSIFEERWFAYYLFVKDTNVQRIFLTDCNDVIITKNPFQIKIRQETLYIGRDCTNKIYHSGWLEEERRRYEKDANTRLPTTYLYQNVYNAGVVGGSRSVILALSAEMINLTLKTNTDVHKDMTLINLVIHNHFPVVLNYSASHKRLVDPNNDPFASCENIISGYPFNSLFKGFENDSDAYFIHK